MAPKKIEGPLYGYDGQEPEQRLADGRTVAAGDVTEGAAALYHEANPGLDASQVGTAWNNLEDARRRDWCETWIERQNTAARNASAAVDTLNVLNTVGDKAAGGMAAELIDAALSEVRALQRPWQQMTEDQQDEVLERLTGRVRDAVGDAIRILATRGATGLVCELESITVKKGAKATLAIPKGELDEELLEAVGQQVILVVGMPDLSKEIEKPKADPSQGDLLRQVQGDGTTDGSGVVHSDPED